MGSGFDKWLRLGRLRHDETVRLYVFHIRCAEDDGIGGDEVLG